VPASAILLLESDATSGREISEILTAVGHVVDQVASTTDALTSASNHQLIVVDVSGGEETAVDVARELRASPVVASIPILCLSPTDDVEARIGLLEAGADDVVARPFDRRELEARVEALLLRFERTKDRGAIIGPDGTLGADRRRTVAVFSPKGGAGTTTIAVNLALIAAQRASNVVVIDFDLQFGQVATHLNIEANQTLVDVVRDEAALREPEVLRTYAARHDRGVHVLAAPPSPQYAELVSPANVEAILSTALGTWDTVVIDAGSSLDERTLAIFEAAEVVILPVYPEIACLKAVHALMDYLAETGSVGAKSQFVLNHIFAREVLKLRDIESSLGAKVAIELPYDPFIYLKAVNEGVPVVVGAPRSAAADRFGRLARIAFGGDAEAAPAAEERRGGLLGGLLRRT
jgi:pilus assembly protein CpaE